MGLSVEKILQVFQVIATGYQDVLFFIFTFLIAFAVLYHIKELLLGGLR